MVKKLLVSLIALALLMGSIPLAQAAERTGDPIELTFFSLNGDYNTAKGEEAKKAVEDAIWNDLGINCTLNMITSDSFSDDQIAVKIAAGELDAISSNMQLTKWQTFIDKGMLLPLDGLLDANGAAIREVVDPKLWVPYQANGITYLIPIQSPVPFYCGSWLRMDLLRKNGIDEIPTTVSELIDALRIVCKSDPSLVGLTAGHISWIYNSGPLNYHRVDAQGNQTFTNDAGTAMENNVSTTTSQNIYWEDDNFKQTLQRSIDLYAEGILDPEIFTTTFDHASELVASDRVVCIGNGYGFQKTADQKAGLYPDEYPVEPGKEQEWVFLTDLVNDINDAPTTWRYGYETGMFVGIITTTKYPEEITKIINWACASNENYALTSWGVQGAHWDYDEEGRVESVKDDAGQKVVEGGLGGMVGNIRADWWIPLTENYIGAEWTKITADEPTTRTWISCDGFINYQYQTDVNTRADLETIASEALVNIVTGKADMEAGLEKMASDLERAGYDQWYAEKNAQYCEGMRIN